MAALTALWQKYKSIIAYLFWGVVTTIVNPASYQWLSTGLHWHFEVATVIAWFLSVLVAYFTNRSGSLTPRTPLGGPFGTNWCNSSSTAG